MNTPLKNLNECPNCGGSHIVKTQTQRFPARVRKLSKYNQYPYYLDTNGDVLLDLYDCQSCKSTFAYREEKS